jgi:hypothetical protein
MRPSCGSVRLSVVSRQGKFGDQSRGAACLPAGEGLYAASSNYDSDTVSTELPSIARVTSAVLRHEAPQLRQLPGANNRHVNHLINS